MIASEAQLSTARIVILGEGHGYHGITIGLYMDQLVRLVDPQHRTITQFFDEDVAQKFGTNP